METAGSAVGTRSTWTPPLARRRPPARARAPSLVRCRAVAMQHPTPPSVRTVAIPFADLKERGKDMSAKIEERLGPDGLGIISISDVPDFPALRRTLLRLALMYMRLCFLSFPLHDSVPRLDCS